MRKISFLFFTLFLLLACEKKPASPVYPKGLWEYSGDLPNGREVVFRVTVAEDLPFVRSIGFAAPNQEFTPELYAQFQKKLEQHFAGIPEMLMRYEGNIFYGIGDVHEGKEFLKYVEEDDTMISLQEASKGLVLRRVEKFTPIAFPRLEEKIKNASTKNSTSSPTIP
ncbi:MAG: hypothetical protein ACK5LK_03830 [Chthoniobacterales bacterium]